jgi:hypothetical protein
MIVVFFLLIINLKNSNKKSSEHPKSSEYPKITIKFYSNIIKNFIVIFGYSELL